MKTETIAEFLARGGAIKKVVREDRPMPEPKLGGHRTMGSTKKEDWNKLKAWKTRKGVDHG